MWKNGATKAMVTVASRLCSSQKAAKVVRFCSCVELERRNDTLTRQYASWTSSQTFGQPFPALLPSKPQKHWTKGTISRRYIQTENSFHTVADETLESIQDALDDLFDKQTLIEYEVTLASGVLTLKLPPHGTWVINKQTPNMQLWWSSPLSGPQRFEYSDVDEVWNSTKSGMNLGQSLTQEIHDIFPELDPLDLSV